MRWMALVSSLGIGCSSITNEKRVRIDGRIDTTDDLPGGVTYVSVHHAWLGEGLLRHPMAFIDATTVEQPGDLDVTFDIPMDAGGEGLVLYAWHDRDGDGVLCSIDGDRGERTGAVAVTPWPTYSATVELTLAVPCAGPETFAP